ncbi:hypothetical protein [Amycolatopsis australiensis]|uniref:Uncharacterized protein n=1 Tax=Amycolatopsis australiensis TaxID=546364 RepID=A0A1K1T1K1_9PSEU|nr:hypothetical protein [Amycolatopsis australiensis]SFW90472.1 hypothetical protein SAMN04489730_7576 [Amycolatopsis australiensis]
MSNGVVGVLLLALGGFLVGGVYSTWKTARFMAVVLGVAALLALAGAAFWFFS